MNCGMRRRNITPTKLRESCDFLRESLALYGSKCYTWWRRKHRISEDIVVVEKDNMIKFMVHMVGSLIRVVATICLLILATIGLFTLMYPEIRIVFKEVITAIIQQYLLV